MLVWAMRRSAWEERVWLRRKYVEMKSVVLCARTAAARLASKGIFCLEELKIFDKHADLLDRFFGLHTVPPHFSMAAWGVHCANLIRAQSRIFDSFRQGLDLYYVGGWGSWEKYASKVRAAQLDPILNPDMAYLPDWFRQQLIEGKLSKRGRRWFVETAARLIATKQPGLPGVSACSEANKNEKEKET